MKGALINPKDAGARVLDLKPPIFDEGALARADEALREMSGSFGAWLDKEVARLQDARIAAVAANWSDEAQETLLFAAHDLKGLGATYEFPIVTQIAASLCRLLDTPEGKATVRASPALAAAHVDAVRATVRDGVKTDTHRVGAALLRALEEQVAALGVAPR